MDQAHASATRVGSTAPEQHGRYRRSVPSGCATRTTPRPRGAGPAVPAAGPQAGRPLQQPLRAVRGPAPGRQHRPARGDRPLRSRARGGLPLVRDPDHPRRAQALFPQHRLVGSRPPARAGARAADRPRLARSSRRAAAVRPRCPSSRSTWSSAPRTCWSASTPGRAHYSVSLDAPAATLNDDSEPETLGSSLGAEDDRFGLVETTTVARGRAAAAALPRARGAQPAPQRRPQADRDRGPARLLADAGLAPAQARGGAGARDDRARARLAAGTADRSRTSGPVTG